MDGVYEDAAFGRRITFGPLRGAFYPVRAAGPGYCRAINLSLVTDEFYLSADIGNQAAKPGELAGGNEAEVVTFACILHWGCSRKSG